MAKKKKLDLDDEERLARFIEQQVEKNNAAKESGEDGEDEKKFTELVSITGFGGYLYEIWSPKEILA